MARVRTRHEADQTPGNRGGGLYTYEVSQYRAGDLNGAALHFAHEYQVLGISEALNAAETTAWLAATRNPRFYAAVDSARDDIWTYATAA